MLAQHFSVEFNRRILLKNVMKIQEKMRDKRTVIVAKNGIFLATRIKSKPLRTNYTVSKLNS
jgi:hypothetical protein